MTRLAIVKAISVGLIRAALLLALRIWHCATTDPADDYNDAGAW